MSLSGADAFGRQASIAVVQAPRALPRLIKMPPELSGHPEGYILLTSLLRAFVGELFPGLEMLGCYQWRVTRNSDLFVDEEEVTNLRHALQGELSQQFRRRRAARDRQDDAARAGDLPAARVLAQARGHLPRAGR